MQNLLTPFTLAIGSLLYGLLAVGFHAAVGDIHNVRDILFFVAVYGWLAVFIALGIVFGPRSRLFFIVGIVPAGSYALLLTVLSWPIFLPSLVLMVMAIAQTNSDRNDSRMG